MDATATSIPRPGGSRSGNPFLQEVPMRTPRILALAALAVPTLAIAQTTYYYREPAPLAREELRECMYRDEDLTRRDTALTAEKRLNDREGASIARAAA